MNQSKKFEYSFTDKNGNTLICEIEEGEPGTVTLRLVEGDEAQLEAALKECEYIGKMLGVKTQRLEA